MLSEKFPLTERTIIYRYVTLTQIFGASVDVITLAKLVNYRYQNAPVQNNSFNLDTLNSGGQVLENVAACIKILKKG